MTVQLFLSEVFVTLAFFALGVVGYTLSKYGTAWLSQVGKTAASENKVASQEMLPCEALTKKVTAQAKNAEARRRAKRQGRSKGHDEHVEKATAELQHWSNEFDGASPYASDECFTEYVIA
jgi:hypothetical protein